MRLRIRSDGTVAGTRVETPDGELVHGIQGVKLELHVMQRPKVTLSMLGGAEIEIDVQTGEVLESLSGFTDEDKRRRQGPLAQLFARTEDDSGGES